MSNRPGQKGTACRHRDTRVAPRAPSSVTSAAAARRDDLLRRVIRPPRPRTVSTSQRRLPHPPCPVRQSRAGSTIAVAAETADDARRLPPPVREADHASGSSPITRGEGALAVGRRTAMNSSTRWPGLWYCQVGHGHGERSPTGSPVRGQPHLDDRGTRASTRSSRTSRSARRTDRLPHRRSPTPGCSSAGSGSEAIDIPGDEARSARSCPSRTSRTTPDHLPKSAATTAPTTAAPACPGSRSTETDTANFWPTSSRSPSASTTSRRSRC